MLTPSGTAVSEADTAQPVKEFRNVYRKSNFYCSAKNLVSLSYDSSFYILNALHLQAVFERSLHCQYYSSVFSL